MLKISHIFRCLNLEFHGHEDVDIYRVNHIKDAHSGDLCFVLQEKYEKFVPKTRAAAVIVSKKFSLEAPESCCLIRVEDVQEAVSAILTLFDTGTDFEKGISPHAYLATEVTLGRNVAVGHFSHIARGVLIGDHTMVGSQVFIGEHVKIGQNTKIYPGVKIYHGCEIGDHVIIHANAVIGSDGFGFARQHDGSFAKIPQAGIVRIGDHVEIGANTVVDRATFGATIIEDGVKLDNLIQVGHNVRIGANTVIAAQSGISGSVNLGRNCMVGGQAAFVPHIEIADGSQFQGQCGVAASIREPGGKYFGTPAIGFMDFIRSYSVFKILPELEKKIHALEKELESLKVEQNGKQKNN